MLDDASHDISFALNSANNSLFAFATTCSLSALIPMPVLTGLWDEWRNPETSETVFSCTLIVTAANDFTRRMHDRMPVLLSHHYYETWLTGKAGVELLRPAPNDLLRLWPVSKRVNMSGQGDDGPSLTEPVEGGADETPMESDYGGK
jgi:SOS response associated peptidase (SRAP)